MRCPECKAKIPDGLLLCPECGTMVEETQPMRARRSRKPAGPFASAPAPPSRVLTLWRRARKIVLTILVAVVILGVSVGLGGYWGLHRGEVDRQQTRAAEADEHYQNGVALLDSGQYELAIAEFERALELKPGHALAQQGITEAQARIAARPTPTVETYEVVAADLYQKAVQHYEAEQWQDAAATLTQLRALDPDYQPDEVEEMLFTSLYNAGMSLLEEDRLEEGIFYLDQAVALRPLDEEALEQRSLAVKYLRALGYWGVDWGRCIALFEGLPRDYKDVFYRLYDAHVAYAEAWAAEGEMCPAAEEYALALQLMSNDEIAEKRAEAEEVCLQATPTPIAPVEGTEVITLANLPPGFTTGRLAYPVYSTQRDVYDVYVLSADRRVVKMVSGGDQPCWRWDGAALGYRNRISPAISLLAWQGAVPQPLRYGTGLAWPTFSPDGGRMAYARQDAGGVWRIYIAPLDGSAEPVAHAEGKGPAWGPNGWLAWTGCNDDDECGIMIDHPDDDQEPKLISGNISDVGLSWSPDGARLAYMSNHTGNWEVYVVTIEPRGYERLTEEPGSDGLPAWAPDGSGLAFVSNRDGTWGLYLMGPQGEDPHKVFTLGPNLPGWETQRLSWAR